MATKTPIKTKLKKLLSYLSYIILSNLIYGIILYFTVTWLATISPFLAFLGNLAFIIGGILLDKILLDKYLQPKALTKEIQKDAKDRELNIRLIKWQHSSFVSFKTSLFFFYIFILIFSQVLHFHPELASEQFASFIHSIDYSVIILLAVKDFGEEFRKDRKLMDQRSAELDKLLTQEQPL